MRMLRIAGLLLLMVAISCTSRKSKSALVGQNELPSRFYTLDPTKDTVLKTAGGAVLTIAAGTLEAGTAGKVRLEIKEAYSVEDIIRGGLLTSSNGHPLSSGGMIYINAADGKTVNIRKPIRIALPTDRLQDGMDTGINWVAVISSIGSARRR